MIPPAEVEMSREDFLHIARAVFAHSDDAMLEKLYPMVHDLRALATHISHIVMNPDIPLSETARGE